MTAARRAVAPLAPAGLAVAAQWGLHRAVVRVPFAPFSVGEWLIRRTPGSLATAAIDHLGHHALQILAAGTIIGALAVGVLLRRKSPAALAAVAIAATAVAARLDPRHPGVLPSLAAAVVAGGTAAVAAVALGRPVRTAAVRSEEADAVRRRLLALGGLVVGGVVLGLADLRTALRGVSNLAVRADRPARLPGDDTFSHPLRELSPVVTPTADHYQVSINLDDPRVSAAGWRLRLTGAVDQTRSWSLDELAALPTIERLATLSCISNTVGGPLVGCSRWTGVPLADLLHQAPPKPTARALAAHGADGYFEMIPISDAARSGVMVAIGMNGETLPTGHGFPARLRVPGHYGVKNVKWLQQLVVLDHDQLGYWGRRGWDATAAVHTESRIDAPAAGATVVSPMAVGGIAWAGDRGISIVEVSADDGRSWTRARLEREADRLAWRRWLVTLDLPAGVHPVTVRATDGSGQLQTEVRDPPHPAGATGWHRIVVTVARNESPRGRVP